MATRKTSTAKRTTKKDEAVQEQTPEQIQAEADERARQEAEVKDYLEKDASEELAAQFDDTPERQPGYRSLNIPMSRLWGEYGAKREKGELAAPICGSKKAPDGSTRSWAFYNVPLNGAALRNIAKAAPGAGIDPGQPGKWRFTVNDYDVRPLPGTDTASVSMRENREVRVQCRAQTEGGRWATVFEEKVPWGDLSKAVEAAEKRANATMKCLVSEKYLSGPFGEKGEECYMWRLPRFAQTAGREPLEGKTAYIPAASVKEATVGPDDAKATGTQLDDSRSQVVKYEVELPAGKNLSFQTRSERVADEKTGKESWQSIPPERREAPTVLKFSEAAKIHKTALADNAAYYASGAAKRDARIAEQMKAADKAPERAAAKAADKEPASKGKTR